MTDLAMKRCATQMDKNGRISMPTENVHFYRDFCSAATRIIGSLVV